MLALLRRKQKKRLSFDTVRESFRTAGNAIESFVDGLPKITSDFAGPLRQNNARKVSQKALLLVLGCEAVLPQFLRAQARVV